MASFSANLGGNLLIMILDTGWASSNNDLSNSLGNWQLIAEFFFLLSSGRSPKGPTIQCPICYTILKGDRHDLKRHMYLHSDVKPFLCFLCGHGLCRRIDVKRHWLRKHPDLPFDPSTSVVVVDSVKNSKGMPPLKPSLFQLYGQTLPQPKIELGEFQLPEIGMVQIMPDQHIPSHTSD